MDDDSFDSDSEDVQPPKSKRLKKVSDRLEGLMQLLVGLLYQAYEAIIGHEYQKKVVPPYATYMQLLKVARKIYSELHLPPRKLKDISTCRKFYCVMSVLTDFDEIQLPHFDGLEEMVMDLHMTLSREYKFPGPFGPHLLNGRDCSRESMCENVLLELETEVQSLSLRTLNLEDSCLGDADLETLLASCPRESNLVTLNASCNDLLRSEDTILEHVLKHCQFLSNMDLSGNEITPSSIQGLAQGLAANHSLENLNLGYNLLRFKQSVHLWNSLKSNSKLQSLNLENCSIGVSEITEIGRVLAINKSLVSLCLSENPITCSGVKALCSGLRVNRTLKKIYLASTQIKKIGAIVFAGTVESHPTLEEINISENKLGPVGGIAFANVIRKTQSLRKLALENCEIRTVPETRALAMSIWSNRTLVELSFRGNKFSQTGAEALGHALIYNETLRVLNLEANDLGDKGCEYLGKGLRLNLTLEDLNLSGNKIANEGAWSLGNSLTKMTGIKYLKMARNHIGNYGGEKLARKIRNMRVVDLTRNKLGNEAAESIARSLAKSDTLKELYLSHNDIGIAGKTLAEGLEANQSLEILEITDNVFGGLAVDEILQFVETTRNLKRLHCRDLACFIGKEIPLQAECDRRGIKHDGQSPSVSSENQ